LAKHGVDFTTALRVFEPRLSMINHNRKGGAFEIEQPKVGPKGETSGKRASQRTRRARRRRGGMGCFVTWGERSRASRPCGLIWEGMLTNELSTPVSFTGGTPVLPSCAIEGLLKNGKFIALIHWATDCFYRLFSSVLSVSSVVNPSFCVAGWCRGRGGCLRGGGRSCSGRGLRLRSARGFGRRRACFPHPARLGGRVGAW